MRFSTLLPLAFLLAAALPAASQNFQKVLPSFSPALSSYARVEWVDADGDKDLDVLAFYHDNYNYANSFVKLYENKEQAFQEVVNSFGASEKPVPISYSTGDYDLDGDVDVLLVDKGTLRIARNNGNLSFSMEAVVGIAEQRGEAQWVDVDADSDLDIYYAGSVAPKSQDSQGIVLVNQLIAGGKGLANQPPASPTGLTARQDEHGMHLGWMPAADDHTPPTGVTYDVILYKGGKAVTKAAVDPATGNRQRLAFGRSPGEALVRNLPYGEYRWQVQAVDQSFRGSALSPEATFFYRPEPPQIHDTTIYRCARPVTLTAVGQNIEWFSDEQLANRLGSGVFQPQSSQVVYVTQTVGGVRGVARKVVITLHDQPDKPVSGQNNPVTYCEDLTGGLVYLEATGTQLRWYTDAALKNLAGTGTSLLVPAGDKSYYVTQTLQGCESTPLEVTLKAITIDTRIGHEGDSLFAYEKEGTFFRWYLNDQPVPDGDTREIKILTPGVYTVKIYKKECWKTSEPFTATGDEAQLGAFPNPATENFYVQIPTGSASLAVKVYNNRGDVVYRASIDNARKNTVQIPCIAWPKGVYQVVVMDGSNTLSKKRMVVQ